MAGECLTRYPNGRTPEDVAQLEAFEVCISCFVPSITAHPQLINIPHI